MKRRISLVLAWLFAFAMVAMPLLLLGSLHGCTGADGRPITAAEFGHGVRVVTHNAAKIICAARPFGDAIALAASGAYPALAMEPAVAKLFCDTVDAVTASLARDAMRVLPAGQTAMVAPTYAVSADGFSVRASR